MKQATQMKRLVAGFCAVGMLVTISADEPVAGWNLARWGMTTAEIRAVYPNTKTVKLDGWDFGGRKYHGDVALADSVRVGGYDFAVRFLMDDSEKLAAVQLSKDFKERAFSAGSVAFDTVKELLIQKYGHPTVETHDSDEDVKGKPNLFRTSVWQRANAQIRLNYFSMPLIRVCGLNVSYAMPSDTDKL